MKNIIYYLLLLVFIALVTGYLVMGRVDSMGMSQMVGAGAALVLYTVAMSFVGEGTNHDEREKALKSARKYRHIYEHYSPLKRASLNARYLSEVSQFDDYLSPDEVVSNLLKHHLVQVEKSAAKFLKNPELLISADSLKIADP